MPLSLRVPSSPCLAWKRKIRHPKGEKNQRIDYFQRRELNTLEPLSSKKSSSTRVFNTHTRAHTHAQKSLSIREDLSELSEHCCCCCELSVFLSSLLSFLRKKSLLSKRRGRETTTEDHPKTVSTARRFKSKREIKISNTNLSPRRS